MFFSSFMIRHPFLPILLMTIGLGLTLHAQDTPSPSQPLPRERVTLIYDRQQGCDLGDTIHFRAFVTRDGKQGPTDYSRVLYVELLTPQGHIAMRRKLPLVDGRAIGTLWADSIYGTGFYELRAYTRYMTNWHDEHYFSRIVPIYQPEGYDGKSIQQGVRALNRDFPRIRDAWAFSRRRENDTVYTLRQPIEKNLMLFGHIEPKYKHPTPEDTLLGNRCMKVVINQGERVLTGDMETDTMGRFALYFPDMQGEWSLRIITPKGQENGTKGVSNRHYVVLDRLFAPIPRRFSEEDLLPHHFGQQKWKSDHSLHGEKAPFFLDCDASSITMKNNGHIPMRFYQYLGKRDRRFERTMGLASPVVLNVARDTVYNKAWDINLWSKTSADPHTVCVDGVSFAGRPVVWIVNGAYRLITGLKKPITDFEVLRPTTQSMPIYVDEVRSVYVTQDPHAFLPYVRCSVLEKKKPVTVFITLHKGYVWDDSVLVSTFFDGFSE